MILINGKPRDNLAVTDRGLQYGDGLFETIAVLQGQPLQLDLHLQRLQRGCNRLHIPLVGETLLYAEIAKLCQGQSRAVLKVIVTRGEGGRGYRVPISPQPTRILMLSPWPEYAPSIQQEGVQVRYCQTLLSCNPALAGIKHLNRLEQVLARNEWDEADILEGLMLDRGGHVIEGTMSNLFLVSAEQVFTPELGECGIEGVMRNSIISWLGENGCPVHVQPITPDMLTRADEVFITNSLIGIWPVRRIAEAHYTIGPLTQRLMRAMNEIRGG